MTVISLLVTHILQIIHVAKPYQVKDRLISVIHYRRTLMNLFHSELSKEIQYS
jgi:hypothetical protein